LILKYCRTLLI